jgi:hypothetical protein
MKKPNLEVKEMGFESITQLISYKIAGFSNSNLTS